MRLQKASPFKLFCLGHFKAAEDSDSLGSGETQDHQTGVLPAPNKRPHAKPASNTKRSAKVYVTHGSIRPTKKLWATLTRC